MELYLLCDTKPFDNVLGPSFWPGGIGGDRIRTTAVMLDKFNTIRMVQIECSSHPKIINEKKTINIKNMTPKARSRKIILTRFLSQTFLFDRDFDSFWLARDQEEQQYRNWMLFPKRAFISFKLTEVK